MALIQEYFQLTKKYQEEYGETTILLMQVGSFYECYGLRDKEQNITASQIVRFSQLCDLNMAEKNVTMQNQQVIMAGFKDFLLDKYVKKIQEAGITAVVYKQDESAKNTTRSLLGIFSPGTYFSMESDTNHLTNNIMCVWIEKVEQRLNHMGSYLYVGMANMDILTGRTYLYQSTDLLHNQSICYDEWERFVSIYQPTEIIIISNLLDKEVNDMLQMVDIKNRLLHRVSLLQAQPNEKPNTMSTRAAHCEKQVYQKELLERFYTIADFSAFMAPYYEYVYACQAFCFLLDFVFQHNPCLVKKIAEPVFENQGHRLLLANHSLKQLNIIDDHQYQGKYSSVAKMLNVCITPMGKRAFVHHLVHPTTDAVYLQREYDMTEHVLQNPDVFQGLKMALQEVKDLSKWTRQMHLKKIAPQCFYYLYQNMETIEQMFLILQQSEYAMTYFHTTEKKMDKIHNFCKTIRENIEKTIDLPVAKEVDSISYFEEQIIKRGIHSGLDENMVRLAEAMDQAEAIRSHMIVTLVKAEKKTKPNATNDMLKWHETEKNNFSLVGTKRRCMLLQNTLPTDPNASVTLEYVSSYDNETKKQFDFPCSKTGMELVTQGASNCNITNSFIHTLCKTITQSKQRIKETLYKVYQEFVERMSEYHVEMETLIRFVTRVDLVFAKAKMARDFHYGKPTLAASASSFVQAKGLRHAIIEQVQQSEIYVPNDVTLDKTCQGVLLYGTNAVGKTSLIRALGIAIIMAQAGLYVPATEFHFVPYHAIFTRILGNDNLFRGMSSFAVEMSELRTILRLANEKSLILGDELCSGTESVSAISIFVAGIQELYEKQANFLFATHLHEIVGYEEIESMEKLRIKHMSIFYDREKDALVYDRLLKDGPGDNMYGLEVCKSLKLPQDFLERANELRMKYFPEARSILSCNTSHFNSKKVISQCEMCKIHVGTEVHHLQHQSNADDEGIFQNKDGATFHKNHAANLLTLCESCHNKMHKEKKQHKKKKTSKGYIVQENK